MMDLNKHGFELKNYWNFARNNSDALFREITRLSEEQKNQYKELLKKFNEVNDKRNNYDSNEKGKTLEDIVSFVLEKTSIFNVIRNVKTPTNEVDQLVTLNEEGILLKNLGYLDLNGDHFICECKNYNKKIDVTWVGKFYSLINCSGCKLGILFSYYGFTGSEWRDAKGLVKKLYLIRENIDNRILIIDFNIQHSNQILEGYNFLDIIKREKINLIMDTNIHGYITKHPAEDKFSDKMW